MLIVVYLELSRLLFRAGALPAGHPVEDFRVRLFVARRCGLPGGIKSERTILDEEIKVKSESFKIDKQVCLYYFLLFYSLFRFDEIRVSIC